MKIKIYIVFIAITLTTSLILLYNLHSKLEKLKCQISTLHNLNNAIHNNGNNTYILLHKYLSEEYKIIDFKVHKPNSSIVFESKYCNMKPLTINFNKVGNIIFIGEFKP